MDDDDTRSGAVPLGSSPKGVARFRPKRVQAEIERVLDMPLNNALSNAATGTLLPQTVVYLLRNFRAHRSPLYRAAFERFLQGVERTADRCLRGLPTHWGERGREMAVDRVIERFASDDLDFFEMSYKEAMFRICVDVARNLRPRIRTELPTEDFVDLDGDMTGGDAVDAIVFRAGAPMPEAEARAQLASALSRLTDRERMVLLDIELADMTEDEVAAKLGCSARNVRYILKRAREKARAEGTTS